MPPLATDFAGALYDIQPLKIGQKPLLIQCKRRGGISREKKKAALYLLAERAGATLTYKNGTQHRLRLKEITREEGGDLLPPR